MAYAYVKYVCDSVKMSVPISFIKNFNKSEFSPGAKYPVFWSPVDGQTPEDVERFQAKVVEIDKLSPKETKPLAAYYSAEVLLVADSKQKLEYALKDKRVIVPSQKKSENLDKSKPSGAGGRKRKGSTSNYVSKEKQKKTIQEGERSTLSEWKKKFSQKHEAESSDACSEDELIPKSKLKEAEKRIAILKQDAEKLQKKVDKLQGEQSVELICTVQADQNVSDQNGNGLSVASGSAMISTQEHNDLSSSAMRSTEEDNDPSPVSSSALKSTEENSLEKKQEPAQFNLNLNLTPSDMSAILRGVKPNYNGDSQFVKNLCVKVFGIPLLLKSSVTGIAKKGIERKPALPLAGMMYIEECFEERLKKESLSVFEKQMRTARIGHYVSEKINDLHKGLKRQKLKALAASATSNEADNAK